jgi:hypothetical protein
MLNGNIGSAAAGEETTEPGEAEAEATRME